MLFVGFKAAYRKVCTLEQQQLYYLKLEIIFRPLILLIMCTVGMTSLSYKPKKV